MVATRFAVATHIMLLLASDAAARTGGPATSSRLAVAVNTNPVVVRRITGALARAGLVRVQRGPGGAQLARPAGEITLDDIWHAVHAGHAKPLVPLHARPNGASAQTERVRAVLGDTFGGAEAAFRHALAATTLDQLAERCLPIAA